MGLLDKLWDDTVAGPRPDTGLSRLRKPSSAVTPRPNAVKDASAAAEAAPRVTRSIMIKRPAGAPAPAGCPSPTESGTPPPSPAGSTPPVSPYGGGGGRFRRKSLSDAYERGEGFGPKSSTPPFEV